MASVRLPSQVGTSSLWSLARVAFALAPGVVFSVAGVTGEGRSLWLVPGLFLVVYALLQVRHAWRSRPSDALIDEHGVRFEGVGSTEPSSRSPISTRAAPRWKRYGSRA